MRIKRLISTLCNMLVAVTLATPVAKADLSDSEMQEMASLEIGVDSLYNAEKSDSGRYADPKYWAAFILLD